MTDAVDALLCAARPVDRVDRNAVQPHLSLRAGEVLRLVAAGYQNRQIAGALCLSPATVARHLANIYNKLVVSTRTAAAMAIHNQPFPEGSPRRRRYTWSAAWASSFGPPLALSGATAWRDRRYTPFPIFSAK
jgi:DNA-binding CsgD family transcriptional regulator